MRKSLFLASVLALSQAMAAPFVYSGSWFADSPEKAKFGGTIREASIYDFKTFNPFLANETNSVPSVLSSGATLFMISPSTGGYIPLMAESMPQVGNNGKRFTVKIRQGMRFSDGRPITADDWVMTYKIHSDKEVGGNGYQLINSSGSPVVVKKVNNYTLQFDFPKQSANAYAVMSLTPWPAYVFGPVYSKSGAKGIKGMWGLNTNIRELVAPGAWLLTTLNVGTRGIFRKNPYFGQWNKDSLGRALPYVNFYNLRIVKDQNALLAAYLAGELDVYNPRTADDLAQVQKAVSSGKLKASVWANLSPNGYSSWITFNWNRADDPFKQELFRDARFRKAISHLANRKAMIQLAAGGLGTETYTSVFPLYKKYIFASTPTYKYDPAAALKLLAEIGFKTKNSDGYLVDDQGRVLEFNLITNAGDPLHPTVARVFIDEAKKVGIKINYNEVDFKTTVENLVSRGPNRKFDAILMSLGWPLGDWPFIPSQAVCGGDFHPWNRLEDNSCLTASETEIAELFEQGSQILDESVRRKLAERLLKAEAEQQAMIYLLSSNYHMSVNARLGGVYRKSYIDALIGYAPVNHIASYFR